MPPKRANSPPVARAEPRHAKNTPGERPAVVGGTTKGIYPHGQGPCYARPGGWLTELHARCAEPPTLLTSDHARRRHARR
ncbi:MAG: hypothetical protein JW751_25900, partial [Polyangiaceae bacterium]|nr:hypothetical protein [Polyangiaceae bacterium]